MAQISRIGPAQLHLWRTSPERGDGSMSAKRHQLAQRRRAMGLSQEQLAERLGVDRSTVVRWERADPAPRPGQRPRLAEVLQLTVEEIGPLLTVVDAPATEPADPRRDKAGDRPATAPPEDVVAVLRRV